MNNFASFTHRTGQPKCLQLIENAMNWSSPSRRNHAPVIAVSPAHAVDVASWNCTSLVSPIGNSSKPPTSRHLRGGLLTWGDNTQATGGNDIAAPTNPASPKLKRFKKERRSALHWTLSSSFSHTTDLFSNEAKQIQHERTSDASHHHSTAHSKRLRAQPSASQSRLMHLSYPSGDSPRHHQSACGRHNPIGQDTP